MTTPRKRSPQARAAAALAPCLLALPMALAACGGGDAVRVAAGEYADVRTDLAADVGLADASVWVGAEMVAVAAQEAEVANPVMSPLSLQLALAVLREGASGEALAQLDAVLGGGDVDAAVGALRARLAAFEGDVAGIDRDDPPEETLVHVADGLFVQEDFEVEAEFLERAATVHGADVATVDYPSGQAAQVLDEWTNEETGGLVQESPFDPDPDTLLTIMDAVVFGARWNAEFDPSSTTDEPFTAADGTVIDVPTMHGEVSSPYATGNGWVAAELPYRDGFAMRVVRHDGPPLDAAAWREVVTALGTGAVTRVDVAMPSWESTVTQDLGPLLVGLGVDAIFTAGDLDGVFPGAEVSRIAQTATITVAEGGTVAAAVTQVAVMVSSAMVEPPTQELRLDSPFEYQVYDTSTGLVLFAGLVQDPSRP